MVPFVLLVLLRVQLSVVSSAAAGTTTDFDSASFSFSNLTLVGDAFLHDGAFSLTRETDVPLSSSGAVICNLPIRIHDLASFSTHFSFAVTNKNPDSFGDGLTFFMSSAGKMAGAPGAYLGIFNSSAGNASVVAVEFDTRLNPEFADPSDNHVGLDIHDPASVNAADLSSFGVNLKSGNLTTAWIDYRNGMIEVRMSHTGLRPEAPVLVSELDLAEHFGEFIYLGFSAATEGSTELHVVKGWSFRSSGFPSSKDSAAPAAPPVAMANMPAGESHHSTGRKASLVVGIIGPAALCSTFILITWIIIRNSGELRQPSENESFQLEVVKGPRKFSYKELSNATRGFHVSRMIGKGAFGSVYKAVMPGTGNTYAVKRSARDGQSRTEFVAELSIIASLRHKNLVQLNGWCDEKGELLLVYQFMPNGSLDKVLYREPEPGCCSVLKWRHRYNVATGIASVLSYLHQECEKRVIHRDIKTSNILLDESFNPRLGDFGLARLMDHNKSPVSTLTAGTMGYLAPEYLQYGKATDKTDVFSYGVVILEVCCGRRPIDKEDDRKSKDSKVVNLVDWVWALYSEDKLLDAADRRLNREFDREEMLRLLLLGLSCANPNCHDRPTMRKVLQILNLETEPVPVPRKKPMFVLNSSPSLSLREIVADCEDDDGQLSSIKIF